MDMDTEKPTILVADDNRVTANLLEYSLAAAGFRVTTRYNGLAAIAALNECSFDTIITDFQMPGACGEEVIQAARASSLNAQTPTILCTAKGYELDRERIIEQYKPCHVATKPFSTSELTALAMKLAREPVGTS
jgi:CheY-like chemotaxis protein